MFYTLVDITAVNSFILSSHSYVPKEEKFTDHQAFREALCSGLLACAKYQASAIAYPPTAAAAAACPATERPMMTRPTAACLAAGALAASEGIQHQRVKMKRSTYVVCKQACMQERRGIKGKRRQVLQALSPNSTSERKDRHVARAKTGCSSCNVALCATRGCWEAFHLGSNSEGPFA